MKCVLHIGTEKTGTTLLQRWLYDNKAALQKDGFCLTDKFGSPNNWQVPVFFSEAVDHYYLRKEMVTTSEQKLEFFSDFRKKFEFELAHSRQCHTWILTSEHFHSALRTDAELKCLKTFLEKYFSDFEIVCYFREQSDMVGSLYSTALKGEATFTFEDLLEEVSPDNYYYNPYAIAQKWSAAFGKENCTFRVYDVEQFFGNDIRKDFMHVIGFPDRHAQVDTQTSKLNVSLSALQEPVFRAINRTIPYWADSHDMRRLNRALKSKILKIDSLSVGKIRSDRQAKIAEYFDAVNESFISEFLDHSAHFPKPELQRRNNPLPQSEVVKILEATSLALLEEISELAQENAMLKANDGRVAIDPKWCPRLREVMDYRIHKWLSETRLVSRKTRQRFKGPAERRRLKLAGQKK